MRVYVSNLSYPECNTHAPYCHLWPARIFSILPHYLINGTLKKKKLLNIKRVFCFSLPLLSETLLILRNGQHVIKNMYWSSCKIHVILVRTE